jgi:hypothetical protein
MAGTTIGHIYRSMTAKKMGKMVAVVLSVKAYLSAKIKV